MRRDSSCSSGGKTEDSLGRACVGPPRDDAKAHRTWDRGRRSSSSSSSSLPGGSGQCNSCNTLPHCLGAVGSGSPVIHCTASLPGGSGQWKSCNTLHCLTAWGQWAVEVL